MSISACQHHNNTAAKGDVAKKARQTLLTSVHFLLGDLAGTS